MKYILSLFFSKFIVYTKFFQWFASDSDNIFVNKFTQYMRIFSDNAPYIDSDINYKELDKIKDKCESEKIKCIIHAKPFKSGTIAIVFKGEIDGEEVAIKILRSGIEKKIIDATNNLLWIANFIDGFDCLKNISFKREIEDVVKQIRSQSDFSNEIKNIKHYSKIFKKYKSVKQTDVIDKFCTDKAIVMTFINGISISKIKEEDRETYARLYCKASFFPTVRANTIHLDLHVGNMLFLEENGVKKMSFLDLGMIDVLPSKYIDVIVDLVGTVYSDKHVHEEFEKFINTYKTDVIVNYQEKYDLLIGIIRNDMSKMFTNKTPLSMASDMKKFIFTLKYNDILLNDFFGRMILLFLSLLCGLVEFDNKTGRIGNIMNEEIKKIKTH